VFGPWACERQEPVDFSDELWHLGSAEFEVSVRVDAAEEGEAGVCSSEQPVEVPGGIEAASRRVS
jgi:hypothetical protein